MRIRQGLLSFALMLMLGGISAHAQGNNQPQAVSLPGTFALDIGCTAEWDPTCPQMTYNEEDGVWWAAYELPAGSYEYKAALNNTWEPENYGLHAESYGPNIPLVVPMGGALVTFHYDHNTHWVTDTINNPTITAPGDYQSEIGCVNDWDPGCLRSWLQDPDGDGIYTFTTTRIPVGTWEVKVAFHESWELNYGAGGEPNGANIPFTVAQEGQSVTFTFDPDDPELRVDVGEGEITVNELTNLFNNNPQPNAQLTGRPTPQPNTTPQAVAANSSTVTLADAQGILSQLDLDLADSALTENQALGGSMSAAQLIQIFNASQMEDLGAIWEDAVRDYGFIGESLRTWDTRENCQAGSIYSLSLMLMMFDNPNGAEDFMAYSGYFEALEAEGTQVVEEGSSVYLGSVSPDHPCGSVVTYTLMTPVGHYLVSVSIQASTQVQDTSSIGNLLATLDNVILTLIEAENS